MMERESGEAKRSGPMKLMRRVPAPATRDQTEGTVGEESKSISSRRIGGAGTTGGVVPGGDTLEGMESGLDHLENGGFWVVVEEVVGSGDCSSSANERRAVGSPNSRAEGGT